MGLVVFPVMLRKFLVVVGPGCVRTAGTFPWASELALGACHRVPRTKTTRSVVLDL